MKTLIGLMLLAGLAHGAGPYKVEDKSWNAQGMEGVRKIPAFYIGGIVLTDKEQAEDLAYALNRAHEERTSPANSMATITHPVINSDVYRSCQEITIDNSGNPVKWGCTETGGSK